MRKQGGNEKERERESRGKGMIKTTNPHAKSIENKRSYPWLLHDSPPCTNKAVIRLMCYSCRGHLENGKLLIHQTSKENAREITHKLCKDKANFISKKLLMLMTANLESNSQSRHTSSSL